MIVARQRNPFSAFTYDLLDQAGQPIGELNWPDFAVARNARLKSAVPKSFTTRVRLMCHGQTYDVEFEYLTRDWNNDIRFMLTSGQEVLASAAGVKSAQWPSRHSVTMTEPIAASLVRTSGLLSTRYALQRSDQTLGTVVEKKGLRLRRELVADLPDSLSLPVRCFTVFLVLNYAYR